jgi:DNA-binding CsgD family transcriptional regulator
MITSGTASAVARLIAGAGHNEGFGDALDRLVADAAEFDMSCAFAFSAEQEPILMHDGYSATVSRRTLRSYLRRAYLLDPFYSACVSGYGEGLWRMRDLAPDDFHNSGFASSREVHPCISDEAGTLVEEIGFIIPLDDGFSATYSLMRNRGGTPFDPDEFERLAALTPIIAVCMRQHWTIMHDIETGAGRSRGDAEMVFQQVFGDFLTPTQNTVTKLILRGHSSLSIANHLGITEGTVKLHRSNIYRRLEISSQGELFKIFIDQLSGSG